MSVAAPGFARHLWLLWGLRLRIGFNRTDGHGRVLVVLAFVGSSLPGIFLGGGFYWLMRRAARWIAWLIRCLAS